GGSAKSAESPRCVDHTRSLTARPRFGPRRPISAGRGRQEGGGVEILSTPPPLGTPGLRCRSRGGSVRQFRGSPAEAAPPFVPGVSGPLLEAPEVPTPPPVAPESPPVCAAPAASSRSTLLSILAAASRPPRPKASAA